MESRWIDNDPKSQRIINGARFHKISPYDKQKGNGENDPPGRTHPDQRKECKRKTRYPDNRKHFPRMQDYHYKGLVFSVEAVASKGQALWQRPVFKSV
jgi:hypothetical protein